MAKITPIDELPKFDKHQLQQILLERDESLERLAKIKELGIQISGLESEVSSLISQRDKILNLMEGVKKSADEAVNSSDFADVKRSVAADKKKKLEEELAKQQAIIDA